MEWWSAVVPGKEGMGERREWENGELGREAALVARYQLTVRRYFVIVIAA